MPRSDWRAVNARKNFTKHGQSNSPTHRAWTGMRSRCANPRMKAFKYYGGRGISVCKRWDSFARFLADMGECPPGMTLERKDVNGNYEPTNCVWATQKTQCRNRRNNLVLRFAGKSMCAAEWAEHLAIPASRIWARKQLGWSDERALMAPRDETLLEFQGQKKPLRAWAKEFGIGYRTLWFRLSKGWSVIQALTTPIMTASQAGKLALKNHKYL